MDDWTRDLIAGYDRIVDEYAARIYGELAHKPFDREMLDRFATGVPGRGPACDLGCGPGQIARYLRDHGLDDVLGVDLSPGMLARARELNPDIEFRQGSMLALDVPDGAWGGIAAFYSIIHIPRPDVVRALHELHRVLRPGGLLLLAFHLGQHVEHADDMWGTPVSIDFVFFERLEMEGYLREAGFAIEVSVEREPYTPEVEAQTRRGYVLARKGAGRSPAQPP
jgi:SAM-dependent methyltransferase